MTISSTGSHNNGVYHNGQGVSQGQGTGNIAEQPPQTTPLGLAEQQRVAELMNAMSIKSSQLLSCLPPPEPTTGDAAADAVGAVAAMDPTEVVYDLFQLMALMMETQMAAYKSGSERRAVAAEMVDKMRWAAAALKDNSVDQQFKASMIKAGFEMAGALVSACGAVKSLGAADAATMQTQSAGWQGVSGLTTAIGAIWSAVEQRTAGHTEASGQRADAGAGSAEKGYNIANEMMQRALEMMRQSPQLIQQVSQGDIQTNTHIAANI